MARNATNTTRQPDARLGRRGASAGFTIVELLIVVVVIASLAAITVVAYNGIQNRAKASAAQAGAKQVATKLTTNATMSGGVYPDTSAEIGISEEGGTTYQYRRDNTTSPSTFCVTATNGTSSCFVS